ncbi:siderophore ABC transporter substrate-binding protein [Georgenia wangjunii]|uniref:siderophore ABC transporter substrate-binding protein n=1 Tax=Georgenia wangjunii TaxID=3117730 RepID=UPI002F2653E2
MSTSRTRRPLVALTVTASASLVLAGCGGSASSSETASAGGPTEASEVTVTHAQGESTVPLAPQRVVVLDMGALDTLDAIGAGDSVVGVPKTSVPTFLDQYAGPDVADVGTLFEPDYEAINELDPDLVIVGFRSAEAYGELSEHWDVIDTSFASTDFLAGLAESAGMLGEVFDASEEVEAALAEIDEQTEEISALAADAGDAMVLSTSGGEVTSYGADSRFGPIFTELGMTEATTDVEAAPHGEAISFELIREINPDWMFVNDRDAVVSDGAGAAAEQILDNELVASTSAWAQDQVVYLDPERWYIVMHGLDNVHAMFAEVGDALAR